MRPLAAGGVVFSGPLCFTSLLEVRSGVVRGWRGKGRGVDSEPRFLHQEGTSGAITSTYATETARTVARSPANVVLSWGDSPMFQSSLLRYSSCSLGKDPPSSNLVPRWAVLRRSIMCSFLNLVRILTGSKRNYHRSLSVSDFDPFLLTRG